MTELNMSDSIPGNILREQQTMADARELKAGQENFYRIWQDYTSPYSYKVMTYMNYKGIPYKRMNANMDVYMGEIVELVGQTIIPVILTPDNQVMQDSTPMLEWFESEFTDKSAVPEDDRLQFLMWLLEEFADEYMPRLHMHTRWGNDQNRNTMSHRIARGMSFAKADVGAKDLAPFLLDRQSGFDQHLGLAGDDVRSNIDQQILDLLVILEDHFKHHQFLLGFKPSLADFALFGPLRVHLFNDPQSNEIMEVNAPRTCRWMDTISELGDTRGCVGQTEFGGWIDLDKGLPESLASLLAFVGKTYIPFAKACAMAGKNKEKSFTVEVYGIKATFSTHQYRVWSFEQLQLRYQNVPDAAKDYLDHILVGAEVMPALMAYEVVHNGLFDGFTPPFVKDGVSDARVKHMKAKAAKQQAETA
jgi:glutathione S-transferase